MSRHDGVVSVLRGFAPHDLTHLVKRAVRRTPRVRQRLGYRVTASWAPALP